MKEKRLLFRRKAHACRTPDGRHKRGRTGLLAALALGMVMLTGCEALGINSWNPEEPAAVSIASDGSVTEIISDTLDAAYYSATELESMVQSEVADYNKSHGEDTIQVSKLETEDKNVSLVLKNSVLLNLA